MRSLPTSLLYLGLATLTVVAYLPVWKNDFVDYDDLRLIRENPNVTAGLTWSSCCRVWKPDPAAAPYWMPITWLSFQFDAHFFSTRTPAGERILSPAAFHGHNIFWHTASVLLLFGFFQRLTARKWPSFLIAALFAVHPMHVESVAWAIERKDVLSGFFGVLTLWAYLRYVEKPGWRRYAAVAAALLLSLLAKPMLITLPLVLLLLDYWPLQRMRLSRDRPGVETTPLPHGRGSVWAGGRSSVAGLLLEKLPLFVIAAVIAVVTLTMRAQRGTLVSLNTISLSSRFATALTGYNWYLVSTFCPWHLGILYPHPHNNWSMRSAALGAATMLACTLLAWQQRRRRPWLIVGWLWFVGTLLPVIGFAQGGMQAWADRFSYWPHIGLFLAVVWELAAWVERLGVHALVCRLAAAAMLGCLTCLTWGQVQTWRDTPTLWQHALSVTGDNDEAHKHLGDYYQRQGHQELSAAHLREAVRIQRKRLSDSSVGSPPAFPSNPCETP